MRLTPFCFLLILTISCSMAAQSQMSLPAAASFSSDSKSAARKRVQTLKITSTRLKRDVSFNLLLPLDYETAGLRYPVLYLLHGSYDNHESWNHKSGAAALLSGLPLIVVMPDAAMSRYVNSPRGGPYADFFAQELVPHIDQTYRTIARREGRALCGLSMGGYGAWRLGLDAPQNFVAAASLSGSFEWGETGFEPSRYRERAVALYGGDGPEQAKLLEADRLWLHVQKNGGGAEWNGPALYFSIGNDDFLLSANRSMRSRLEDRRIPFVYAENPGEHTWDYWNKHLRDAMTFLMLHLAAPVKAEPL